MKIGDIVKYKTSKNSLQFYYGVILNFKMDKIEVTKSKFSDLSGTVTKTWVDKEDLIFITR